ncbi:MAG: DUF3667 domain-containing protein [Cytophagales bacterium]|nr:DUF3667 domain-containing protein [Cytophagales bacterium]
MNCDKCGHPVSSRYCSNCGKITWVQRFDGKYFLNKVISAVDLSKGFFITLFRLLINPGIWLRRFIIGEIDEFSNPLKMFLIVGAVTNYLTFQFSIFNETIVDSGLFGIPLVDVNGYNHYSTQYFSFFTLTAIPLFSVASWLLFLKSGFNFLENLVFNLYVGIGQFLVLLIFIPILATIQGETITIIYGIFNVGYNLWALIYFFQAFSIRGILLAFFAIALPQIIAYFMNYLLYRIMPQGFWSYLDNILG